MTVGEHGLWRLRFGKDDDGALSARDIETNGVSGASCSVENAGEGKRLMIWTCPQAKVKVEMVRVKSQSAAGRVRYDMKATVEMHDSVRARHFDFPARLRFDGSRVKRFVFPMNGAEGPGFAFNERFFSPLDENSCCGWKFPRCGPERYIRLYGGPLRALPLGGAPKKVAATPVAREWFGDELSAKMSAAPRAALRPPYPNQADIILLETEDGAFLSGKKFGSGGVLWRFAGVEDSAAAVKGGDRAELLAVPAMLAKIAAECPRRRKLGMLAMARPLKEGFYSCVTIDEWRERLKSSLPSGCEFEEIATMERFDTALFGDEFFAILNPYGEGFPAGETGRGKRRIDLLGDYLKGGGSWFETGGYSFFKGIVFERRLKTGGTYPNLFCDYAFMEAKDGATTAFFGMQGRSGPHEPWRNPKHFAPAHLEVGSDERGGWLDHSFHEWADSGDRFETPTVRISHGGTYEATLDDYAAANGFNNTFEDKMPDAAKREKVLKSMVVNIYGAAKRKIARLDHLPSPSIVHYFDYLKGGFDKEYPDHLPPRPEFGTAEELKAFHARAHALGHLVMPYTNPTWWCDHPRGPTFLAAGEAPLLVAEDGRHSRECYGHGRNDGWTITLWHPAVRAANRKTLLDFRDEYGIDLLFQDQCGARGWLVDLNPASPSPLAYTEGLLSMLEEDFRDIPLGCEDGWDHVANCNTMVFGAIWRTLPHPKRPSNRTLLKTIYPPETWTIEPISVRLFHGKTIFMTHNGLVTTSDPKVLAWEIALGYTPHHALATDSEKSLALSLERYRYLHELNMNVLSRHQRAKLVAFTHDRAPMFAAGSDPYVDDDDGTVVARYSDGTVVRANLGDVERVVDGVKLGPYGWKIVGNGVERDDASAGGWRK